MSEQVTEKPEILVVDDSKVIRFSVKKMLAADYKLHFAEDGQVAWEILQKNNAISVVFTDLNMPNLNGMELLSHIRCADTEHIADLPVIIITGHEDSESIKQEVFDAGATDFIAKPFESIDLVSRAKAYARLSRKVVELEKKTGYDDLTGLYNASSLEQQGIKAVSFASRHKLSISVVLFEIPGFEEYFLNHGKSFAQNIIVAVGKRMLDVMREEDIAARIGVAKYVLVLPMTGKAQTKIVINRVRESINKLVFDTGKEKIRINFVAGYIAPDLTEESNFKDILEQADDALQQATNLLTENIVCYGEELEIEAPVVVTEQDIEQAFSYIMDGDFYKIPEQHIAAVFERLSPFMQYADSQMESEPMAGSAAKNMAI
jgi:two-component system cell cycle response regulator